MPLRIPTQSMYQFLLHPKASKTPRGSLQDTQSEEKRAKDPEKWNEKTWKGDSIEDTPDMGVVEGTPSQVDLLLSCSTLGCTCADFQRLCGAVFSQVKFIVETIGVSALGNRMETRLMSRINDY